MKQMTEELIARRELIRPEIIDQMIPLATPPDCTSQFEATREADGVLIIINDPAE